MLIDNLIGENQTVILEFIDFDNKNNSHKN